MDGGLDARGRNLCAPTVRWSGQSQTQNLNAENAKIAEARILETTIR
jgi:hypothetical protein